MRNTHLLINILLAARTDAVAVSLPTSGIVVSGLANGATLATAWRYGYTSNTWTQVPSIPTAGWMQEDLPSAASCTPVAVSRR